MACQGYFNIVFRLNGDNFEQNQTLLAKTP